MKVVLEQNFIKNHGYDSVSKAKAAGWSSVKPSNVSEKNTDGKFIWDVITVGTYSMYRKSGVSSSTDSTDTSGTSGTSGQSAPPKPSVTPIPIKDWMKSKTGQTKTTTSQYIRCENATIQKKWCVSELIKKAQVCLKEVGYDLGTSGVNRDGVDGYWGEKTDAALRAVGFGSGIDKQAVEVICNTADRVVKDRVAKQLKDKADQEYKQKYGSMERAAETDYLYFGDTTSGGGDEEASGEGMEGETLFFN
jgi:hypothetical protein